MQERRTGRNEATGIASSQIHMCMLRQHHSCVVAKAAANSQDGSSLRHSQGSEDIGPKRASIQASKAMLERLCLLDIFCEILQCKYCDLEMKLILQSNDFLPNYWLRETRVKIKINCNNKKIFGQFSPILYLPKMCKRFVSKFWIDTYAISDRVSRIFKASKRNKNQLNTHLQGSGNSSSEWSQSLADDDDHWNNPGFSGSNNNTNLLSSLGCLLS